MIISTYSASLKVWSLFGFSFLSPISKVVIEGQLERTSLKLAGFKIKNRLKIDFSSFIPISVGVEAVNFLFKGFLKVIQIEMKSVFA